MVVGWDGVRVASLGQRVHIVLDAIVDSMFDRRRKQITVLVYHEKFHLYRHCPKEMHSGGSNGISNRGSKHTFVNESVKRHVAAASSVV